MLEFEIIELAKIFFAIVTVVSILFSLLFYVKIKHGKRVNDFLFNLLIFYGAMSLKNTDDENRKKFKRINNICMVFFWISIIGQFILFITR